MAKYAAQKRDFIVHKKRAVMLLQTLVLRMKYEKRQNTTEGQSRATF